MLGLELKWKRSEFVEFLLLSLVLIVRGTTLRAQSGPPPEGKRVATVVFGGAYDGPRTAPHRSILGRVTDKDGKAMHGTMVYLKDLKTSQVRVLHADDGGEYRFSPLSLNNDYEVWAENGVRKSRVKPVGSYITTNEVSVPLRLEDPSPTNPTSR